MNVCGLPQRRREVARPGWSAWARRLQGGRRQIDWLVGARLIKQFYRHTLEGCSSCHKASDKPYLRPRIPEHPKSRIINFELRRDVAMRVLAA